MPTSQTAAWLYQFLSTPSVGRATETAEEREKQRIVFLSTPSVGRATGTEADRLHFIAISIHALRGEGDSKSA